MSTIKAKTKNGIECFMPVGGILAFGGLTAPDGWFIYNGAAVSRTTYADLFAVIGTAYGAGATIKTQSTSGRASNVTRTKQKGVNFIIKI